MHKKLETSVNNLNNKLMLLNLGSNQYTNQSM